MEVVLPRSRGRRIVEAIMNVLPDIHQFLPISSSRHLVKPTAARGSLEASVERVEAQVDGMSHDDRLRTRGHHHTRPCLSEFAPSATM
jgi:hypothetical protein